MKWESTSGPISTSFVEEEAWAVRLQSAAFFETAASWFYFAISAIGAIALTILLIIPRFFLPAEDAVILYQYSHNLAETGAITYISHGPHAEGATDFGWMLFLAAGVKAGLDAFWLAAFANAVSLIALAVMLFKIAGRRVQPVPLFSVIAMFALVPQFYAAASGFSTFPFACLLTLLVFCFLRRNDVATPLAGILLCLFRPDGVVFSVPLLMAAVLLYPDRWRRLKLDALLFLLPGILYFLWRWQYFHELLPLPFLVKSDVHRVAHLFVMSSVQAALPYCVLALVLLWLALRGQLRNPANRVVLLTVVLLPNLFYFAMRLDQNIGDRFFIYLPVGTALLLAMNWSRVRPLTLLAAGIVVWAIFIRGLMQIDARDFWFGQFDNRKAIAQDLAKLPNGKMIITEAGILTFYSHWTAYDAWGLNTPQFAKRLFQPSDISAIRPDLILVNAPDDVNCSPQPDWLAPYAERTWANLTRNMIAGASAEQYGVWIAPFGNSRYRAAHGMTLSQGPHECWYVRRDSALSAQISDVLAQHGAISTAEYVAGGAAR